VPVARCDGAYGAPVFSTSGARVVVSTYPNAVTVLSATGAHGPMAFDTGSLDVTALAFTADAGSLVVGGADGTLTILAIDGDDPEQVVARHAGAIRYVAPSEDGALLLSVGEDGSAFVWTSDGEPIALAAAPFRVERAAFTPDGRRAIARYDDGMVRVWSVVWEDLVGSVRRRVDAITGLPPLDS